MVRSIGPIGKKAGSCARVPPPAVRVRRQRAPVLPLRDWLPWPRPPWGRQRRSWPERLWQQPWSQQGLQGAGPRRRASLPWWRPWVCWYRLSLPGLLAVRAGPCTANAAWGGWQAFRGFTGARLYRPGLTQTETLRIQHKSGRDRRPVLRMDQTRLCSSPCRKMSLGRSMPMKTILLKRCSPSAHWGPRSLPMSWCTPWKITLRSVPFILSTPL